MRVMVSQQDLQEQKRSLQGAEALVQVIRGEKLVHKHCKGVVCISEIQLEHLLESQKGSQNVVHPLLV